MLLVRIDERMPPLEDKRRESEDNKLNGNRASWGQPSGILIRVMGTAYRTRHITFSPTVHTSLVSNSPNTTVPAQLLGISTLEWIQGASLN
ncbi:hypothetical protein CDAR_600801 [Caerostris darwini]|uniref:Uncharacterized protein n=1 Tax=Caerostris darwini TaxID=1538125 RepID=A0AAV4TTJ8_9ARAC|nr:hypothetical protein CDAR_600801 [Caerostris darwini]